MAMLLYAARRLAWMGLTLLVVTTATFFLFRAVPGDPSLALIGPDLDPALQDKLRADFGLDKPLFEQYVSYLWQALHGDLGVSFRYREPVTQVLAEKLLNTLALVLPAMMVAFAAGSTLGAVAGMHWGRPFDTTLSRTFLAVKSAPVFWTGTLLLMVFSYQLGWFPTGGMTEIGAGDSAGLLGTFFSWEFLQHLALPLVLLSVVFMVEPMLTMRTSMLDVLHADFVELAKAQGLSGHDIVFNRAARNALLPVVSLLPAVSSHLVGGQVIVETVFSWPGMGREMVDAVNGFDYPMLQGAFLLIALLVTVVNAVSDLLYAYLDPRVRLS
jgi:ABC-type dipeptide/oligopeptide/nickel transport system permease component